MARPVRESPDIWHVGELPGDHGCAVRDENGLEVERYADPAATRDSVRVHNATLGLNIEGEPITEGDRPMNKTTLPLAARLQVLIATSNPLDPARVYAELATEGPSPDFDKGYDDGFADGHNAGIALTLPALRQAAQRFRHYEGLHAAKASPDGDAKAQNNADMAEVCERTIAEAEQFSPDARPAPALQAVLDNMLAYEAERFDAKPVAFYVRTWRTSSASTTHGPYDDREVAKATLAAYLHGDGMMAGEIDEELGELDVNGADMVDAFTEWRGQIREALHARRTALADGADVIAEALRIGLALVEASAEDQASGVAEGVYDPDPDVTAAIERKEAVIKAAIKALDPITGPPHPAPLCIGIELNGGLITEVWADRACPGVEVLIYDFDVEGGQDLMQIVGGGLVAYSVHSDLGVGPMPDVRHLESDGPS